VRRRGRDARDQRRHLLPAAKLATLYAPYININENLNNYKFARTMELAAPAVRRGEVGPTEEGTPTTKIYISAGWVEKAYRPYLQYNIELRLGSRNEEEALLGARLLWLAGVEAEAR
jgi:hypothetical protein